MRRTTTTTVLATVTALAGLAMPLGLAAAPAHAAETCDGRAATIVVTRAPGQKWTTTPVTGTPGDDVIVGSDVSDTIDGAGGNVLDGQNGRDRCVDGEQLRYCEVRR